MQFRLAILNETRKHNRLADRNDAEDGVWYCAGMATPAHDWYLKEWLQTLHKKQADIVRDLDWNKARVSLMLHGKQQYDRDSLNELSDYLNLHPYELLMHPKDAMALRRLRADLLRVAHDVETIESETPSRKVSSR